MRRPTAPPQPFQALWQALSTFIPLPEVPPAPLPAPAIQLEPLEEPLLLSLQALLGENRVACSPELLHAHAGGETYPGFVRRYRAVAAPLAVIFPESEQEIAALMEWAGEREIQLLPWGGGNDPFWRKSQDCTSFVVVNLERMNRLLEITPADRQVKVQAGIRWTELEKQLETAGMTTGQTFESPLATVGGSVSSGVMGLKALGYGTFHENLTRLRAITPAGLLNLHKPAPGTPDWRGLLLSSHGTHGIITELSLRLFHLPTATYTQTALFASWEEALATLRQALECDLRPTWARILVPKEAALLTAPERPPRRLSSLLRREEATEGEVQLTVGVESCEEALIARYRQQLETLIRDSKGRLEGNGVAGPGDEPWRQALALLPALWERGILAHTLITAVPWPEAAEFCRDWEEALRSINEATGGVPGFVFTTLYAAEEYALIYTLLVGQQAAGGPEALQTQLEAIYEVARETTWRRNRTAWESNLQSDIASALTETLDPAGVLIR